MEQTSGPRDNDAAPQQVPVRPGGASCVGGAMAQLSFLAAAGQPEGLSYRPGFLSEAEEASLVEHIAALPFRPFEFQGFLGKRETVSFGWSYRFDGSGLARAEPIPDWLLPVRDRAAAFAGLDAGALEQALLIRYGEGAGLGWHRDRPVFDEVAGISLLAPAPLRFRRRPVLSDAEGSGTKWERFTLTVEPRSLYLLRGPARASWEHSIPPVAALRYAITLRSMKKVERA
jgi:alkylated DNA repair dioxygenase AlkB